MKYAAPRFKSLQHRFHLQCAVVLCLGTAPPLLVPVTAAPAPGDTAAPTGQGYRIDQPGTITFTVGVKISGKVEKPQVMIFLPKEKTQYRDEVLTRSFIEELSQPLPFTPLTE